MMTEHATSIRDRRVAEIMAMSWSVRFVPISVYVDDQPIGATLIVYPELPGCELITMSDDVVAEAQALLARHIAAALAEGREFREPESAAEWYALQCEMWANDSRDAA